jgi:hypothetical protein
MLSMVEACCFLIVGLIRFRELVHFSKSEKKELLNKQKMLLNIVKCAFAITYEMYFSELILRGMCHI